MSEPDGRTRWTQSAVLDLRPDPTEVAMRRVPAAVLPLRHRDFRLLWSGLAVSLVGSGLWLVALAWQVISLGGGPAQLSLVTALYSVGLLAFVLVGGVAADRMPQRLVMLAADLVRAIVLVALGALSISGNLAIWHLAAGGVVIGAGESFFIPSYTAILPRLLPEQELLAANGLEGSLRPCPSRRPGRHWAASLWRHSRLGPRSWPAASPTCSRRPACWRCASGRLRAR